MRRLHVDARRGIRGTDLLGALVELGAPAGSLASAQAMLGLPAQKGLALVRPLDVHALLDRAAVSETARWIASDAAGRMLLAQGDLKVELDGAALALALACATALDALRLADASCSRVGLPAPTPAPLAHALAAWDGLTDAGAGETDLEGAALLCAFVSPDDAGGPEPAWLASPKRGRGGTLALAVGNV